MEEGPSFQEDDDFGHWELYDENAPIDEDVPIFRGTNQVLGFFTDLQTPLEFLQLFVDDNLLDLLSENTDTYYKANNTNNKRNSDSHKRKWTKPIKLKSRPSLALCYSVD